MIKIGLLIISTNKYNDFLQPLISSADTYFLKDYEVSYFIFTNDIHYKIESSRKINFTEIEHKPWPWMTLGRYEIFNSAKEQLSMMNYLFYCDVDMLFVDYVDQEILSERVATQHPGYYGRRGTPENNPQSLAFVHPNTEMQYFAGGFNGGSSNEYLKMAKILSRNIQIDYNNGIIAEWHDESHMNKYFSKNYPTKILSPSYCYGENMVLPFTKKILALDKNHKEMRN